MRWLAVAAALSAAAFVPAGPPGAGVVIVAVLIGATAAAARRPNARDALFGGLAVVLASFAALRDAGWVVAVDLTAAWLVASVAAAGGRKTAVVAPWAALNDLPTIVPRGAGRLAPALRGTALGGFLVVPFAALFLAADAAFAELGGRIPLPAGASLPLRAVIFAVVLAAALGLALAARRPRGPGASRRRGRLAPVEWAIPLGALVILFVAFVAVQLAVLFGGHDHVLETAGLTYAEYAREGFWELLVAGGLTLAVIGAAFLVAGTPRRSHRLLLRALLGALCLLTLVVLASALHRLHLYEDAFGLTRARLAAEASIMWMGGAFLLVMLAGIVATVSRRFAELAVGGTAVALIVFSAADPDRLIAERNVDHWRETGRIDVVYLSGLSADAVPALDALDEPLRSEALLFLSADLSEDEPWSSTNLARARAREVLRERPRSAAAARSRSRRPPRTLPAQTASGTAR
jgi:hypothetical protein